MEADKQTINGYPDNISAGLFGEHRWRVAPMRAALHSPASTGLILPEEAGERAMFLRQVGKKVAALRRP